MAKLSPKEKVAREHKKWMTHEGLLFVPKKPKGSLPVKPRKIKSLRGQKCLFELDDRKGTQRRKDDGKKSVGGGAHRGGHLQDYLDNGSQIERCGSRVRH